MKLGLAVAVAKSRIPHSAPDWQVHYLHESIAAVKGALSNPAQAGWKRQRGQCRAIAKRLFSNGSQSVWKGHRLEACAARERATFDDRRFRESERASVSSARALEAPRVGLGRDETDRV